MLKVEEFIDVLREKGLSVTYQRLLIFKHLTKTKGHPTAEEIHNDIKSEYASISLATVYKTLETLAEHNFIAKVNALHDMARFELNTTPHHHLVCLQCKNIVDIHDDALNNLPVPSNSEFRVSGYRVQFEGVCQMCDSEPESKQSRKKQTEAMTFCGK